MTFTTGMTSTTGAVIIPFTRTPRLSNRMSLRDRSDANEWAERGKLMGYNRIVFDFSASDDDPELGDFILIYERSAMWASWGVGCSDGGFIVWRPATSVTHSRHFTIRHALATIPPAGEMPQPVPQHTAMCLPFR